MNIKPFTESYLEEAGALAARAFSSDPGFSYIFDDFSNDEVKKLAVLSWFWERYLWISVAFNSENYMQMEQDKIVSMSCIYFPTDPKPTLWRQFQAGIAKMPFVSGWKSVQRSFKTASVVEALEKQILWEQLKLNPKIFAKLEHVAVDPPKQGGGYGKRIVLHCLKCIQEKGYHCYLTTQKASNVEFYKHLGFELVGETVVDANLEHSPKIYLLIRR